MAAGTADSYTAQLVSPASIAANRSARTSIASVGPCFLQLAPTAAGLDGVRITVRVRSDADDKTLEEIRRIVTSASPVYDSVRRPVSIESQVVRA